METLRGKKEEVWTCEKAPMKGGGLLGWMMMASCWRAGGYLLGGNDY